MPPYSKNTWVDEVLAGDSRYNILENDGTSIESNVQIELDTSVVTAGTPLTAARMNNIEAGIENVSKASIQADYSATSTLTGTKTLTDSDVPIQFLDPGGSARDVILPVEAGTNHSFVIVNSADAAETLTVKNDAGDTIGTVAQSENKMFVSNGVAWKVLSGGGTAEQIKETSGPTTLTIGDIANGEYLKRNGTSIEGGTPAGGGAAVVNKLLNGGFSIWQRGGIASAVTMTDNTFNGPDMWFSLIQGSGPTVQRIAGGYNSQYALKMVMGGTTYRGGFGQVLEAGKSIAWRGKNAIFQFMAKAVKNAGSGSIDIRCAILEWTGTADEITVDLINDWASADYTIGASKFFANSTLTLVGTAKVSAAHNVDTAISVTGEVSTSCNNLIVLWWIEDVPDHAADYIQVSEAGIYEATAVQDWKCPENEQSQCERFCEVISSAENGEAATYGVAQCASTTRALNSLRFRTLKRRVPDVSLSALSDWAFYDDAIMAFKPWTSVAFSKTTAGCHFDVTCSGGGLGGAGHATLMCPNSATTNARIYITAEIYKVS